MLSEEALILIAAFGGLALFVLGILELFWPSRPRHPRRPTARDPWRRARTGPAPVAKRPPERADSPPPQVASCPVEVETTAEAEPEPPIERLLRSEAEPVAAEQVAARAGWARRPAETRRAHDAGPRRDAREVSEPPPAEPPEPPVPRPEPVVAEPVESPPAEPAEPVAAVSAPLARTSGESRESPVAPVGEESPVDRCSALWEAQRYAEVASEAMAALTSASMLPMDEVAKLWGLAGLAKQALGDHDGARAAFEEAILASSAEDRPTWERHLAALALDIGRSLLARSQGDSGIDPEERVGAIRSAITWLDGGVAAVPGDAALREAAAEARRALWPTYEEVVAGLVQRQEFHLARRLLREAMADEECPPDLQGTFRDLLAATFGGEVGQLTAEAIRRMQEGKEEEAVATLERAETLLATIPADGLPAKRRQELERRLWWSYTKLGLRRVEGGMYEEALPPLLHALGFTGVGPERQEETRGALVRALEAIVEARSGLIRRLADEGDLKGASLVGDRVRGFLKEAMDRGVTREELATALNKAQQLFERLGRPLP